ncbi:hypothetical protein VULLAG_LOCUS2851 [Vulpes lagopus]
MKKIKLSFGPAAGLSARERLTRPSGLPELFLAGSTRSRSPRQHPVRGRLLGDPGPTSGQAAHPLPPQSHPQTRRGARTHAHLFLRWAKRRELPPSAVLSAPPLLVLEPRAPFRFRPGPAHASSSVLGTVQTRVPRSRGGGGDGWDGEGRGGRMSPEQGRWRLRTHFRATGGSGSGGGWEGDPSARGGSGRRGPGGGVWAACPDPAWGLASDRGGPQLRADTRPAGHRLTLISASDHAGSMACFFS